MNAGSRTTGRSGSRGARARVSSSSGLSGNGTSSGSASLLHLSRAGTGSSSGGLGSCRAGKVASCGSAVLLNVVFIQGEGKLLLGGAHAVRTILTGSGVGSKTTAVGVSADSAEELGVFAGGQGVGDNTACGIVHAFTEVHVGARGEGRGLGRPLGADGGTASQCGVGRSV